MTKILEFIPKSVLDAKSNLADFVVFVKCNIIPLKSGNTFDMNVWNVEGIANFDTSSTKYIYFSKFGVNASTYASRRSRIRSKPAIIPPEKLLQNPFLDFAKGVLAYTNLCLPSANISGRLSTLKYLEESLIAITGNNCPSGVSPEVLNYCCNLATTKLSDSSAYNIGTQLQLIYGLMKQLHLLSVDSEWKSSLRSRDWHRNRVGSDFENTRNQKLPDPKAFEALAHVFNSSSQDPRDIFATSISALLLCDPSRSKEILNARTDLLTMDWKDPDTGEIGTGLRWFPVKGGSPTVKTVIPSMRDVAKKAIENLLKLSEPARTIARWYELNPDKIFLPANLEHLRFKETITYAEAYAILFGGEVLVELTKLQRRRTIKWLKTFEVPCIKWRGKFHPSPIAFSDLQAGVLRALPSNFPIMDKKSGLLFSEALCISRLGEFFVRAVPINCCIAQTNYSLLSGCLKSKGNNSTKSVFERWGFKDSDGKILEVTSHMFRHYLNTLVRQSGYLSEEEIASWSGRKSISQNTTYNHMSDRDVVAKLRTALGDPSKSIGPFQNLDNRVFILRKDFPAAKIITAHTTEYGHCIHDYAQSPCQIHQDCMNCNEQVCIKGDKSAENNLRQTQSELIYLQQKAKEAFDKEVLGSAEWFIYQSKTLDRVNQLVAIMDDPSVAEGAVIQLTNVTQPSRFEMAEKANELLIKADSSDMQPDLSLSLNK